MAQRVVTGGPRWESCRSGTDRSPPWFEEASPVRRIHKLLPLLAVAFASSAATAAVLVGTVAARGNATPAGHTLVLKVGDKLSVPAFKWRCMISTERNTAGKDV